MKFRLFLLLVLFVLVPTRYVQSQIIINKTSPYNSPAYLVDNILLGGGVVASNHVFMGDSMQIGFFNAINANLGLDSGIVMATGDVDLLDPNFGGFGTNPPNIITDPDLLAVANSVPPLIGQTFSVSSINDVARLEFDFIPTSDTVRFRYVFGSQEYHTFENTQYNDVFGFFLSGPGIVGPYFNNSINLAIVPNSNPPLPITISSVHNGQNGAITPMNPQYFVDNSSLTFIADADGFTTVLTAIAVVQCGQTYHIRLAIADGSDQGLSSYVWLEAGSFTSPTLEVNNDLGIDSTFMQIPCNTTITLSANGGTGATYQWFDFAGNVIGTDSSVVVGAGSYFVAATSLGCAVFSDTLTVFSQPPPTFDFGSDYTIPCNTTTTLDPLVSGGTGNYVYIWNTGSNDTAIDVGAGFYQLTIDDGTPCQAQDSITISESNPPSATVFGGGSVCDDGTMVNIQFDFLGLIPWSLTYTNGVNTLIQNAILDSNYNFNTLQSGNYTILQAADVNGCMATFSGAASVVINPLPEAIITPQDVSIYVGQKVTLSTNNYSNYLWYFETDTIGYTQSMDVAEEGNYYVWVEDANGCTDMSSAAYVTLVPKTELFIPSAFTPNGDEHNDLLVIHGVFVGEFQMNIFNRWGELMYSTDDIQKYWDGKWNGIPVIEGVYYYTISLVGADQHTIEKQGTIHVIY